MIWLLKAGVRTGLVAAAMAAAVAMMAFAQTPESTSESVPPAAKAPVDNSSPTGDENSVDNDTCMQNDPPFKSEFPAVSVEMQRLFNELRRELLDDQASYIDRWLAVTAIVLTFFGIIVAIAGIWGFNKFGEIESEAKKSVENAEHLVEEIKCQLGEAEKMNKAISEMNAQIAADAPERAKQAIENVQDSPAASLIDRAIADAIALQQQGKRNAAIEKWRAVASLVEGTNNDLAAAAWFSVGFLHQDENPEAGILAYDKAIRLKPDLMEAYTNRGNVNVALDRYVEAIADYDEAISLKSDDKAYSNRGVAKAELGQYEAAIADHDEAIRQNPNNAIFYNNRGTTKSKSRRWNDAIADFDQALGLKSDLADAYHNRGSAKYALGLKNEARRDFETALELARKANNAKIVAQAEEKLRNLATDGGA